MSEPVCTSGSDHYSVYTCGHWRCTRCGYHGCHEGDCEPGRPVVDLWDPNAVHH